MGNSRTSGVSLILSAAILWGTTGTAQSFATMSLSPFWIGAARLMVAGCFLLAWVAIVKRYTLPDQRIKAMPWKTLLLAALCMAIYNLAFFAGVKATGVALGTAIALGSGPVWAGALQAVWLRRLPGRYWWLATIVAITGLIIASASSISDTILSVQGIGLCLLSGLCYAIYALVSKQLVSTASAITTTAVVFMAAAVFAIPMAWMASGTPYIDVSDLPILLWLGIVATGVAYLLFNIGLKSVSGATAVALALAEPIAALVLAVLVVGERLSIASSTGMLMVFVGLCMLVQAERQRY